MQDERRMLYLVRHAKSSWAHPGLEDIERPLNERGKRDAPDMGRRLREQDHIPDCVISSPANRARSTARHLCSALGLEESEIEIAADLYFKGTGGMLDVVERTDDRFRRVMLVGHNPTMTELVHELTGTGPANMPTCAIAIITFSMDSWGLVRSTEGNLLGYDKPKGTGRFSKESD